MALTRPDASQLGFRHRFDTVEEAVLYLLRVNVDAQPVQVIAHRGFADQAPQNTLLAFSTASKRGAHALECDVQVSSDGVLYCFHDDTVDALTSGTGTFTALESTYLDGLTFDETVGTWLSDMPLTKFADLLTLVDELGIPLYAEIKNYRTQADIALIVQAIESAGVGDLVTLCSSVQSDLDEVRELHDSVVVAQVGSTTTQAGYESVIDKMATLGRGEIIWLYSSLISTPAIIEYARSKGVDVVAWTVDNQENMARVMRLGVRKVISNVSLKGEL